MAEVSLRSRIAVFAGGFAAVLFVACGEAVAEPEVREPTVVPFVDGSLVAATETGCYDRGYAGMVRDPEDEDGKLYFLVEPPDDPADAAKAVAETLCVLGGRYPHGKVRVEKADYTLKQLDAWYAELNNAAWSVDGVYTSGRSERTNRILYRVLTEKQREAVYEQVERVGVPTEAVVVDVREPLRVNDPPAQPRSEAGLELSLVVASQSQMSTEFAVVLTNVSGESMEVEHGWPPEIDVGVFTLGGRQVWRHQPPVIAGVGKATLLAPGEEVSFPVEWDQRDLDGEPVRAGEYVARGYALRDMSTDPIAFRLVGSSE